MQQPKPNSIPKSLPAGRGSLATDVCSTPWVDMLVGSRVTLDGSGWSDVIIVVGRWVRVVTVKHMNSYIMVKVITMKNIFASHRAKSTNTMYNANHKLIKYVRFFVRKQWLIKPLCFAHVRLQSHVPFIMAIWGINYACTGSHSYAVVCDSAQSGGSCMIFVVWP